MAEKKKIVIADDSKEICQILETILTREGYIVDYVHDGFSLLTYLKTNQDIDVVILDLIMPEKGGISVFETVRSIAPASKLIIYTGYSNYKHTVFGREADAFVNKVDGVKELLGVIEKLIK
ncbi:MAG: response regulator [Candidatus Omnitrophica bacterium]|nr:response regulator [Candidatus Omnitrophota bacterium]